jgi:2-polyprenyl-3-methyl-5-hydroxy-6-metoxy-1,4-benzoquinol methylase
MGLLIMVSDKVKLANRILHDKEALYYDILHGEIWNFYEQLLIKRDIGAIFKIIGSPARVLDVGCGTGNLSLKFLMLGSEVTALDISQRMLDILRSKVPNALKGRIRVVCKDADEFLSQEKDYYDVICFSSVLHHLPDYLATLNLAISKLNSGGIIYIVHEPLPAGKVLRSRVLGAIDGYLNYLHTRRKRMTLPTFNYYLTDIHSKRGINLKSLIALMKKET